MKIISLIASALLVFVLSGCGGEAPSDSAPVSPKMSLDDKFLSVVHDQAPSSTSIDDESLVSLAKSFCRGYDAGLTNEDFFEATMASGVDVEVSGAVLGAGVGAYCPEHMSKVS